MGGHPAQPRQRGKTQLSSLPSALIFLNPPFAADVFLTIKALQKFVI